MSFTTLQQVIDALPGQSSFVSKTLHSIGSAGRWASQNTNTNVGYPAGMADPSSGLSGNVPTNATAGALDFANPPAGKQAHVARCVNRASTQTSGNANLILYDRLWHNSGISATSTAAQTINSVALTRPDANGDDVEAWWQIYASMGAGTPTVTLGYTNSAGTSGRTATWGPFDTTAADHRTGPFQLDTGDTGVRSIQSWTNSATFTSGTIGAVLRRLIMLIPNVWRPGPLDLLACGLPRIPDDACLEVVWWSQSSSLPTDIFLLHIVNG